MRRTAARALGRYPAASLDLFQWLPETIVEEFRKLASRRRYLAGRAIYWQGDAGVEVFRIVSGIVRVSVMRADGRELVYMLFGEHDVFGETSVIDGHSRPHTAEAQSDLEVDVWSAASLASLRGSYPQVTDALLQLMTRKLRVLSSLFAQASLDEVAKRVAGRLLATATNNGFTGPASAQVLHLSQGDLALMVGASRQSVNRALQQLQDAGVLTVAYGTIQIHDVTRLRQAGAGQT